jgi:pyrophosphatase PpaX
MRKIDTILFDFDGTIMNTNDLIISGWRHAIGALSDKEITLDEIKGSFGEKLQDTAKRFLPDVDTGLVIQTYRAHHNDIFQDMISLFPGVTEMLEAVKAEGYTMGLVTSRLIRSTNLGLEKYDLHRFFEAIVTVEDTELPKPSPQPMLKCLGMLGKTPETAIMVGDSKHDVEGAKATGVVPVLVDWSLAVTKEEREGAYKPDFILYEPMDILDVLNELNK